MVFSLHLCLAFLMKLQSSFWSFNCKLVSNNLSAARVGDGPLLARKNTSTKTL